VTTEVTKTLSTESPESGNERIYLAVLSTLGVDLPETAKILDFGCGAGRIVRALRARGFVNVYGYDVGDGRTLVGAERDHIKVGSLLDLRLPYEDNTFDLVISDQVFEHVQDQVRAFEELLLAVQDARAAREREPAATPPAQRGEADSHSNSIVPIRFTAYDIRRLQALIQPQLAQTKRLRRGLTRSRWRRCHQAVARDCHRRRNRARFHARPRTTTAPTLLTNYHRITDLQLKG
jgi:SAM-dependent methyltransferase